ncbi:tRNA (adenosine(37)-N6)-threonylcarbamoyltransferase complex ATPase subunit type 1 TsaE [uncultured Cohaesibacter sp.]|uniref:tRNA (adenosine(37)-N6)-threonylcarbamoyltransferase complex ATPase subunit type 1 TsaE n=1 Tax=uncultured Cohaesibacter sp. TaxID=1002546 RepID=UPI002AAB9997|nr:tRNA (adenosine(37)-N6)-threonylcarbamoyltransferase complex ATPase subunit type 1 TsaE [uncultured Cohaesibacter sp.]
MADQTSSSFHNSSDWSFTFDQLSEAASAALAADIAPLLACGDVLALEGDLGMGKSFFARALLRARADDPFMEVPSPTFTLVQGYDIAFGDEELELFHFDLYRISDSEELYEIGFEEAWETGAALVEWPDRADDLMPASTLWLSFVPSQSDDARHLTLSGDARWGERIQRLCAKRQLLIDAGWGDALRKPIASDLSPRTYDRVRHAEDLTGESNETELSTQGAPSKSDSPQAAILMDMPERQPGPKLVDGRLYDLVAHRVTRLAPMLSISEGLEAMGLRVPKRYGVALDEGLMLWEDFGAMTLAEGPEAPVEARYMATVTALAALHQRPLPDVFDGSGGQHTLSRYDKAAFEVELDVFLDHYWPHIHGAPCPQAKRTAFKALWSPLLDRLVEAEPVLVLRDVQDPNCFWLREAEEQGEERIGFIDFQDCLIGPNAYDLAALCMDARVTIPASLADKMLALYKTSRALDDAQSAAFDEAYHLAAAQRISKNLGAFSRAANEAGRTAYLSHIPRSLAYLARSMDHPLLETLHSWYQAEQLMPPSSV